MWDAVLQQIATPVDLLVGVGMGVGSNAAVIAGAEASFTDSAFIGVLLSFGLVGLVAATLFAVNIVRGSDPSGRFVVWPPVLLALAVFNAIDVSPVNVLLCLVVAGVAGRCAEEGLGVGGEPGLGQVEHVRRADVVGGVHPGEGRR